jgi:hypothetical protein
MHSVKIVEQNENSYVLNIEADKPVIVKPTIQLTDHDFYAFPHTVVKPGIVNLTVPNDGGKIMFTLWDESFDNYLAHSEWI